MDKRANFRLFENFEKLFRAIVSDNHSASVLAYELPLKEFGHLDDNLFTEHDYQKIKNVRNNLLNYKRFIFPAFEYDGFEDPISFKGDQIFWKLFHDIFEKDSLLEVNLRRAPRIAHKVLHPGNCKQNVLVAIAIFHESTSAALTSYFPEKKNEAEFLNWIISNSKVQFSNHILGHAAKKDDGKPEFCRALTDWIENWCNERVPLFKQFTLPVSTAQALIRTLRCKSC